MEGSPRQLEASWTVPDPVNGVIQNYTISCNGSITFDVEDNLDSETVSFTLMNELEPFTTYECSVFATTNGGQGMATDTVAATTTEDSETII